MWLIIFPPCPLCASLLCIRKLYRLDLILHAERHSTHGCSLQHFSNGRMKRISMGFESWPWTGYLTLSHFCQPKKIKCWLKGKKIWSKSWSPGAWWWPYLSTTTPLLGQNLKRCYRTTRMVLGGLQGGGLEPHLPASAWQRRRPEGLSEPIRPLVCYKKSNTAFRSTLLQDCGGFFFPVKVMLFPVCTLTMWNYIHSFRLLVFHI